MLHFIWESCRDEQRFPSLPVFLDFIPVANKWLRLFLDHPLGRCVPDFPVPWEVPQFPFCGPSFQ